MLDHPGYTAQVGDETLTMTHIIGKLWLQTGSSGRRFRWASAEQIDSYVDRWILLRESLLRWDQLKSDVVSTGKGTYSDGNTEVTVDYTTPADPDHTDLIGPAE